MRTLAESTRLAMLVLSLVTPPLHAQVVVGQFEELYTLEGPGVGGSWGIVACAGDVTGDGFPEVIVGNPQFQQGAPGGVSLYSGVDGTKLWERAGATPFDALGWSVAGAGDVDRDGIPDVIAGAHRFRVLMNPGDVGVVGQAFVLSGDDGAVIWTLEGQWPNRLFGFAVAGAGDVNGDGFADVIVGEPGANPMPPVGSAGSAYVYSGRDATLLLQIDGQEREGLGGSVAGAGDVNHDGFSDVIVGAPSFGRVYVYSGKDGSILWQFNGPGELGWSVSNAGDVNQDGFPDVVAGAPFTDLGNKVDAGSVHVYSGKDGSRLWSFGGVSADDGLGYSVDGAGDVNGDGFDDLLASATGAGAMVFSGSDGSELWRFQQFGDQSPSDALGGYSVAGIGYVNRDLFADVVLGRTQPAGSSAPHASVHVFKPAVARIGTSLPGTFGIEPTIGFRGGSPQLGNQDFKIDLLRAASLSPCLLAGSVAPAGVQFQGLTLYGDFLTPGNFLILRMMTDGNGFPGTGTASVAVPIPNRLALLGFTTYWQWFVLDPGSPVGVSHTQGLAFIVIR